MAAPNIVGTFGPGSDLQKLLALKVVDDVSAHPLAHAARIYCSKNSSIDATNLALQLRVRFSFVATAYLGRELPLEIGYQ